MNEYLAQADLKQELIAQQETLKVGLPTVVKFGGSVVAERASTLDDVAFLHKQVGISLVIVHGGGPEIDATLKQKDISPQRVYGLRITDSDTLGVVVSVLNRINHQLVTVLQELGVQAVGFNADSGLLKAVVKDPRLGFVGAVSSVNTEDLKNHINLGVLPVITPIATMQDNTEQFLNINGDTAAGAIAASLSGNLILVTDVPGVMDKSKSVVRHINNDLYKQMLAEGSITSGMIPKIKAGIHAVTAGGKVNICQSPDLLYFFTEQPKGTLISNR